MLNWIGCRFKTILNLSYKPVFFFFFLSIYSMFTSYFAIFLMGFVSKALIFIWREINRISCGMLWGRKRSIFCRWEPARSWRWQRFSLYLFILLILEENQCSFLAKLSDNSKWMFLVRVLVENLQNCLITKLANQKNSPFYFLLRIPNFKPKGRFHLSPPKKTISKTSFMGLKEFR